VPDVLNRVTRSGVVVKNRSCKLLQKPALQDLFEERGVGDSGSDLFRSALELQFSLLDPSLDQLVKISDVGRFFDASPSLVMISFYSEMRRIDLVVGVIFVQEGRWSGPPQICDGPTGPSLSDFRLAFQLCLLMGSLEGGDLRLELIVDQRLLFTSGVLMVESGLLPIAI